MLLERADLAGTGAPQPFNLNWTSAWVNTTYRVNVTAWDQAGNANTSLREVQVQVAPTLTHVVPASLYQDLERFLRITTEVTVPGFPGARPDAFQVKVTRNGTLVFNQTVDGQRGLNHLDWNATTHDPGSYTLEVGARMGTHARVATLTVNLTQRDQPIVNLTTRTRYASLNGTSDWDLYRIQHPGGGDWFTLKVEALDGHDVDLHLTQGDPTAAGTDPAGYSVHATTGGSTETHTWTGATANTVYSLLVRHKAGATHTSYRLTYTWPTSAPDEKPPEIKTTIDPDTCRGWTAFC